MGDDVDVSVGGRREGLEMIIVIVAELGFP